MKIYLAGPLFSKAERNWIREIREHVIQLVKSKGREADIVWPYEVITKDEIDSLGAKAIHEIFTRNKSHIDNTDILIAILDGVQVDDGTAWEIGYFYANKSDKSYILGIRTDFRNAGDTKHSVVNLMIEASCDKIVTDNKELLKILTELI
jgi:nucleoside 2-deoxyribosyltransferase